MRNRCILFLLTCLFSVSLSANSISIDSLKQAVQNYQGKEKLEILTHFANVLLGDNLNGAEEFADEAMTLARHLNNRKGIADSYLIQGKVFQAKYDYTNAMRAFVGALKIRNEQEDEAGLAESKSHIGRVFYLQENYVQAEENLSEALEVLEKLDQKEGAAETNKCLGDVYLAKKIYGKALESYRKALDLKLVMEDVEGGARMANHIGKVSRDLGDYDGALVYFSMSRDLHASVEDLPKIAQDFNNIALTSYEAGTYEEAEEANQTALELRQQLKDTFGIAESLKNFGLIYSKLDENEKAQNYLSQSVGYLSQIQPQPGMPELYRQVSESYATLKNFDAAYQNHLAFSKSRDRVFNQEKSKALLDLTTKYESEFAAEEQKRTIELLEVENATSRKVRYFLFVVLALIATLLINLYLSFKRKQKDNQALLAKNEEIARQNEEIDGKNLLLEDKNASLDVLNKKLVDEIAERESIEKSSFARDRFLATMSHEMRTPINIIIGLTHLLLDEDPRDDQIEHLRTLQFSANNLVVFINDVLDFSKIEAGKLDLTFREFKPRKTFFEVERRFNIPAEEKGVLMQYDYDKKIPENLLGDPARLSQIITNLVTTAFNYTDEGHIDVTLELNELAKKQAGLKLRVADTGRGIEQEKIEEMFRTYSKGSGDIFEGYASSNLSLAITKRLVDLQNGKIEVDSRVGEGTVFTVYLPFKIAEKKLKTVKTKVAPGSYNHLAGNRILLVEDNRINQLVVAKMLRKLGIEIVTADNGLEALEEFDRRSFDLVLMDIQMPKMDGYRTTAEIRKNPDPQKRDIPIIALTASAFLTEKEKAKLFGMNDHVGKPFGPDELLEKISGCLEIYKVN